MGINHFCPPPSLPDLTTQVELCPESMTHQGIKLGTISSHLNTLVKQILKSNYSNSSKTRQLQRYGIWRFLLYLLDKMPKRLMGFLGWERRKRVRVLMRPCVIGKLLPTEVIKVEQGWRKNAVKHLNQTGGFRGLWRIQQPTGQSFVGIVFCCF